MDVMRRMHGAMMPHMMERSVPDASPAWPDEFPGTWLDEEPWLDKEPWLDEEPGGMCKSSF